MGILSFLNREKRIESSTSAIILGIVLLKEETMVLDEVLWLLQSEFKTKMVEHERGEEMMVLTIADYQIVIAPICGNIPDDEVKEIARYNYYWPNAIEETAEHNGHIIISLINAGKNALKENLLFSKVVCAILKSSNSLGFYMGGRTLLLEKDFYLNNAIGASEDRLPLYNWIYFGLRQLGTKQSIYTYGLSDFGKQEMEIINSEKTFEELNALMYNIVHYVLVSNVHLKSGEMVGLSWNEKFTISKSKGKFVHGTTLKISY